MCLLFKPAIQLSGKVLEEDEKASSEDGTKATQLDNLMGTIEKLSQVSH